MQVTRFEGTGPVARYWLAQCEGFEVTGGARGVVEEMLRDAGPHETTRIVVRHGRRRRVVPVRAVVAVDPAERVLVVEPPRRRGNPRPRGNRLAAARAGATRVAVRSAGATASAAASLGPPARTAAARVGPHARRAARASASLAREGVRRAAPVLARSLRQLARELSATAALVARAGRRAVARRR